MDRLVVWLSLQRTGSVRVYRRDLLRRSYRDEQGRPQKETLANLSALPDDAIGALRKVVAGRRFGGAGQDV